MAKKFEASQSVWFVARVMGAKRKNKGLQTSFKDLTFTTNLQM